MDTNKPVKDRIIETADRLFYTQGYRATGINQIIKEASVAKASFYQYFPSKEDLCVAYLQRRSEISYARQKKYLSEGETPAERVANLFTLISDLAQSCDYNGCHFLNISAEIHETDSKIREVVATHKSKLIELIKDQLSDYENSNQLSESVYILYEGTIMAARNFRKLWPIETAKNTVKTMLEKAK